MLLQTHTHVQPRCCGHVLAAGLRNVQPACKVAVARGTRHIARFKQEDKDVKESSQTGAELDTHPPTEQAVHRGHLDPIARSREALSTLLGRHGHSSDTAADVAGKPAGQPRAQGPRTVYPPAFEAPLNVPVFSRRREVLVGRVAMAAFYATCQWEVLTGLGPLSQLSVTTGCCWVRSSYTACTASAPAPPPGRHRTATTCCAAPRVSPAPSSTPSRSRRVFFGYSSWGFTKANEVFAGRIAMLGWLGVASVEPFADGKGAIGQIAWWLHLPTIQAYYQLAGVLLVVVPLVFGALAYVNKRPGQVAGGDDIY